MSKHSSTPTCCLTLPLRLEKWQADRLTKRFEIARQIYNTLVHYELKKLRQLERSSEYRNVQSQLFTLYQENKKGPSEYQEAGKIRSKLLKDAGFSEYGFTHDMKYFYKHFNNNIGSSVAVLCIAKQVWRAFDKKLYGNGKRIHYKEPGGICTLQGATNSAQAGGSEIMFRGTYIEWKGLHLPLKVDPSNQYETEMLQKRVKFVRILRRPEKKYDHWYAQLALEGVPAIKRNRTTNELVHPVGHGPVGIDIGPQTIAYVSQGVASLEELADRVQNIEHEKRIIQRKMDRSRRAMNPDNYAPDGTIRKGVRLTRNKSNHYKNLQHSLSYMYHKQASIRKYQHTLLANHLLSLGDCFYVEDMPWSSLTRRAKETAISEKTGKYKRKKRFGKSISNKAPAMLIEILKQKCDSLGLPGVKKVPLKLKASQYNHITGTEEKKELSQRWNYMPDGRKIQRDLYSAFLLQHVTPQLDGYGYDSAQLHLDYEHFVLLHDQTIQTLINAPKTISSMGISRSHSNQNIIA